MAHEVDVDVVRSRLTRSIVVSSLLGVVVMSCLVGFALPGAEVYTRQLAPVNFVLMPAYIAVACAFAAVYVPRRVTRRLREVLAASEPSRQDRLFAVSIPVVLTRAQALAWGGSLVLLPPAYGYVDARLFPVTAVAIVCGGLVVCANSYLLAEAIARPVSAWALEGGNPRPDGGSNLSLRAQLGWLLGTGVPLFGVILVASAEIHSGGSDVAVSVLAIGVVGLVAGLVLMILANRAIVAPVRSVRAAMAAVEKGDLDVDVVVFDGTELGDLQSGFNRMVRGLRERERLRDLLDRQVGAPIAETAVRNGPEFDGQLRDVAVLFVDIVGSTGLVERCPPKEAVRLINQFFRIVVGEIAGHGGVVNKFEGDGALAIFGAPEDLPDGRSRAVESAAAFVRRARDEQVPYRIAIGISAGTVVAGHVGTDTRFEYTVVGAAVHEAARLCEVAKRRGWSAAAAGSAIAGTSIAADAWVACGEIALRGRSRPTAVYRLAAAGPGEPVVPPGASARGASAR